MRLIDADPGSLTFDATSQMKRGVFVATKKFVRALDAFLEKHSLTQVGWSGNNDRRELIVKLGEELTEEQAEVLLGDWEWQEDGQKKKCSHCPQCGKKLARTFHTTSGRVFCCGQCRDT